VIGQNPLAVDGKRRRQGGARPLSSSDAAGRRPSRRHEAWTSRLPGCPLHGWGDCGLYPMAVLTKRRRPR